jgi:glycerol-3-phosphate O-acyltransferase
MEKNLKGNLFIEELKRAEQQGAIPAKYAHILGQFFQGYAHALQTHGISFESHLPLFSILLKEIIQQCKTPFAFEPYHRRVTSPMDYTQFGIDLLLPLCDEKHSTIHGMEHLKQIIASLEKGENVIFLANHQTEGDPQAISILLKDTYPNFANEMIFVAGERVITDPLAVPFSMGRNLLCIYSKRYIDHPPEEKMKKQLHNKRTMELMSELLSEGGKAIYVAPSGGRDRPNTSGVVEVAPFDPQSIEMLYLMSQRAGHPTHFHPMTLKTYSLLPPPESIQVELGEARQTQRGAIHIAFGPRIDMEHFSGSDLTDKRERRQARADAIYQKVKQDYANFP